MILLKVLFAVICFVVIYKLLRALFIWVEHWGEK